MTHDFTIYEWRRSDRGLVVFPRTPRAKKLVDTKCCDSHGRVGMSRDEYRKAVADGLIFSARADVFRIAR